MPWTFPTLSVTWHVIANGFFWLKFWPRFVFEGDGDRSSCKSTMLVAISPVLMLPFIWFETKKSSSIWRLACAGLVVLSSWIIIQ